MFKVSSEAALVLCGLLLGFLFISHPRTLQALAAGDLAGALGDVMSDASSTPGDDVPPPVDGGAATTTPANVDGMISSFDTTATTTQSDATSTEASSTQDAPPTPEPLPVPEPPPDNLLKMVSVIPKMGAYSLLAERTTVRVRFAPNLTTGDSWSGIFAVPQVEATSTIAGATSAISFGPETPISLDQYARIEFAGQASSTAVYKGANLVPITTQCVAGGAQAPRDLFLTYHGPDCTSHWGRDLVIITNHTGTFAAVRSVE